MFSSMNIAFSSAVYFKYADGMEVIEILGIVAGWSLIGYALMALAFGKNAELGEFKNSFHNRFPAASMCSVSIAFKYFLRLFLVHTLELFWQL